MSSSARVYSYLRFSTPEQLKGDSLRRQLEKSRNWCKTHGYILDESLTMKDLGFSAYSGAHKTKGALGSFLKAVKEGNIPEGSILLVESLDRLSREDVLDASTQFTAIIKAGIEIVTLIDGSRYSRESVKENWTQLILSLAIMSRANEESKSKSNRLSAAWQAKRSAADKRKLTAKCPAWLRLNRRMQIFEPIPERVGVVERIFKDYLDGQGAYVITRRLNEEGVKTFGRAKNWGVSSIKKILHNRSVLGEYQPHRLVADGGKRVRVTEGEPLEDYYPRIIDDETFFAVQKRLSEKTGKGGRVGFVNNLFQHVAYCGICGGKMSYDNKGKWQYMRCGNSKMGRGCDSTPWVYKDFEMAFLNECQELDASAILSNGNSRAAKIKLAKQAVAALEGRISENDKLIANYEKAIEVANSESVINKFVVKLEKADAQKTELERHLSEAQIELSTTQTETVRTEEQLKSLKDLVARLDSFTGDELIQLRKKLKNTIAGLVERIVIFPDGMGNKAIVGSFSDHWIGSVNDTITELKNIGPDPDIFKTKADYFKELKKRQAEAACHIAKNSGKANRAFVIYFKSGGYRLDFICPR